MNIPKVSRVYCGFVKNQTETIRPLPACSF